MSKKHVDFYIEPKVVVVLLSIIVSAIAILVFVLDAGKWIEKAETTHGVVEEIHNVVDDIKETQDPRITALEKKNSDYQTMWDEQIKERQRKIDHAFEVCRAAGECD